MAHRNRDWPHSTAYASRQGRLIIAQRFIAGTSNGGVAQSRQGRKTLRPTNRIRVRGDMRGRTPSCLSSLPGLRLDRPPCPTDKSVGYCRSVPTGTKRELATSSALSASEIPRPIIHSARETFRVPPFGSPMLMLDGQYEFGESLVAALWCEINHRLILRKSQQARRSALSDWGSKLGTSTLPIADIRRLTF